MAPTTETRDSAGVSLSGICARQRGIGTGLSPSHSVFSCQYCNVLGLSIHDVTSLHSKSQYTTVKHSRKLFEHTYTSDPHGLGTLIPIEFFQQDLLFLQSESFQTHVRTIHRRAISPLSHHNVTSAYSPSLTCHLPVPTIECLHRPPYKLTCSSPRHTSSSVFDQFSNHTD
jgi:hypothetical protein